VPATPLAVLLALKSSEVMLEGKNCVVLGRSNLVGFPTFNLLNNNNATVLLAHKQTNNIKEICKQADILVVAIGSANKIDSSYVKENAVVIDVGINTKIVEGKKYIYGDCNTEDLLPIVSKITKVPMGIGRLTVISLMVNITKACYNSNIK
jgi:methylenetetrahydrofolate dehydrogenase (NADP+)/methenyltetrahydrofolate cyclohydrolase